MQILISGASGLVGTALQKTLREAGHSLQRLVRNESKDADDVFWNYGRGHIDEKRLKAPRVVIHLAGENVASGLWTESKRQAIVNSRVQSTTFLSQYFASQQTKPELIICASAIGIYGDRGAELLSEESPAGQGFLAEVVKAWEASLETARQAGIPTLHVRIGLVLDSSGGILANMKLPFQFGLGGVLGSGRQYMSWITLRDLVQVFCFAIDRRLTGILNAVAPAPVTNAVFTRELGRVLHRPTLIPVPAFALRLLPGNMGQELFLNSTRVLPERLHALGFDFQDRELGAALESIVMTRGQKQ